MRSIALLMLVTALGGCAFPKQVQRFGVEYNSALEEMTNEQTLRNILRARDGMPTHFTSVAQFRGNINLTAGANLNAQLRGAGATDTLVSGFSSTRADTTSNTVNLASPMASPVTTSVISSVTTPVMSGSTTSAIAEGVDLFTPQVNGQIVSGTTFDVNVFDTQEFYQGITGSIPFSTIDTFLNQGIDSRLIARLLISRIDFRLSSDEPGFKKGQSILSISNDLIDTTEAQETFATFLGCYTFGADTAAEKMTNIVAANRLTRDADGKATALAIDKVIVADGDKFAFTGDGISKTPSGDDQVFLAKVTPPKRVPRFVPGDLVNCNGSPRAQSIIIDGGRTIDVGLPTTPPKDAIYLQDGQALLYVSGNLKVVPVNIDVTFRSTDGLFRYLGAYLRAPAAERPTLQNAPLFSVANGRSSNALVHTAYRGAQYSLINDPASGVRNAQIFTMLQQLVNLQRKASERPTVVPVRAIP